MTAPAHPAALTRDDPFVRRFAAWAKDRFPAPVGLLFTLMFLAVVFVAQLAAGSPPTLSAGRVAGAVAFVAFYFGLRVYDEHKDLDVDRRAHPERLTVTGVLPLSELRALQLVGLAVQVAVCVAFDRGVGAVTVTWLVATGWSLLMLVEFFLHDWLAPRMVAYALTHQVVVPLTTLWAATFATGRFAADAAVLWLCVVVTATTLTFELTRKMVAPEDERPEVDTYTRAMGATAAPLAAVAVMVVGTAALAALARALAGPVWVPAAAVIVLVATAAPVVGFARTRTPAAAHRLEPATALYVLATYVILLAWVLTAGGLRWM